MRISSYTFHCRLNNDALLPAFKGSTLRGALGRSLRRTACALRRRQCDDCLLAASCAYALLYETESEPDNPRAPHRPHPYIIMPPECEERHLPRGAQLPFTISLFGPAITYLPFLVHAVQEMGREGLGRRNNGHPGTFELNAVLRDGERIFNGSTLKGDNQGSELLPDSVTPPAPIDTLTVRLRTPLRLKHMNRLSRDLPFHLLVRAALRRCSTLENCYGNGEPDFDYRGMVRRAERIGTARADCRWQEIERWSNRQKSGMLFGGLSGTIVYRGVGLEEFVPLLRYCEQTGLGKQTSFGLGRIELITDSAS